MILIDTNVILAIMLPSPATTVINWLNNQDAVNLYLSTITIAEIGYGLQIMPDAKRKQRLTDRFKDFVSNGFEQRILDFDDAAAYSYAEIMAHRRTIGRPLSVLDGQIASIARVKNFAVATRNIRAFEECTLKLINPFEPE